jgi:hypothetical protein
MDEDDLPPPSVQNPEVTLPDTLGEVFGAMIWIVALLVLFCGVAWVVLRLLA